jgi:hypothetical protein
MAGAQDAPWSREADNVDGTASDAPGRDESDEDPGNDGDATEP